MFIDIHILQSVPPSNINRDDTGSPKSAVYGGVRRARVSSQAWKRATRLHFNERLSNEDVGYRTRRVAELLGDRIAIADVDHLIDDAPAVASRVLAAGGIKMTSPKVKKGESAKPDESGYLLFLSVSQLAELAELAVLAARESADLDKKRIKEIIKSKHSVDVAIFGRMVADDAELNVDAAVQVAHAISVHAVEQEFDYFTAVDDVSQSSNETGAGMIGTIEFNSSTLYRYATINVAGLQQNLGGIDAASRAASTFVDSFVRSMPSGKQNSFANGTLPDLVLIDIRDDQPVNLVGAFEIPVSPAVEGGVVKDSVARIVEQHDAIADAYGRPRMSFYMSTSGIVDGLEGAGDPVSLSDLDFRVGSTVADSLAVPL